MNLVLSSVHHHHHHDDFVKPILMGSIVDLNCLSQFYPFALTYNGLHYHGYHSYSISYWLSRKEIRWCDCRKACQCYRATHCCEVIAYWGMAFRNTSNVYINMLYIIKNVNMNIFQLMLHKYDVAHSNIHTISLFKTNINIIY